MKNLLYRIFDRFTFNQIPYLKFFIEMEGKTIVELQKFQFEKLQQTAFRFGNTINTWDDFYRLPVTTKADLPNKPNVPDEEIKHMRHQDLLVNRG